MGHVYLRKTAVEKLSDIIIHTVVLILALITVWPFLFVFSMSISAPQEVIRQSIWLLPKGFNLMPYKQIVMNNDIWRAYANTILYVATGTFLNCVVSFMTAYALTRMKSKIKKFITIYMLITMYFYGGIIPYFILINKIGLYNNMLVMIIPWMVSVWNIILVRTFIRSLPESLVESAKIDGAKERDVLFRIILPMSKSMLAVVVLYTAVGIWNNWINALFFLPNKDWQPLQYFLAKVLVFGTPDLIRNITLADELAKSAAVMIQIKYAAIIVCSLPIICSYPFLQKYFLKGSLIGSLKE